MTIDEAIKTIDLNVREGKAESLEKLEAAMKLGIEALKRVQYQRSIWGMEQDALLPGETNPSHVKD